MQGREKPPFRYVCRRYRNKYGKHVQITLLTAVSYGFRIKKRCTFPTLTDKKSRPAGGQWRKPKNG